MKNIFKRLCLLLTLIISIILIGCSSEKEKSSNENLETQELIFDSIFYHNELFTVKDTIEAALSDAMQRLKYYDNSGLYENEFAYVTDETTFGEYLKFGQISYHPDVDVLALTVDSLNMFAHDSALVWVTITAEQLDGKIGELTEQKLIVYYHNNKWIKPTASVIRKQIEYDELIKQAEEASQWEDE